MAFYLALRLPALLSYAPTYDEPIYVGAGKHFVTTHTPTAAMLYHPPLAYHLTSLPLWFVDTPLPPWDPNGFASQVGLAVLYGSRAHSGAAVSPQEVLLLCRLPVLAFGLLGLVLCRDLGRRLAGERCGFLAAAAWAVSPDVAAQSMQATTDLVAAVAALLLARAAIRHFDAAGVRPEFARTTHVTLGAICGFAALAKHTLLVPVAIVAVLSIVLRVERSRRALVQPRRPLLRFCVACAAGFLVLWAGYLFEFGPIAAQGGAHEHAATLSRATGFDVATLDSLLERVPVPAPTYLRSLADAFLDKAHARSGTPWVAYLNGAWDERGFLAYFPVALAVKTPTALLVVMLAGLPAWWVVRRRTGYAADLCMAFFAIPFAVAALSRLNIGVRHLLPATPFLVLFGCAALALVWERHPVAGRATAVALALLLSVEWAANRLDPLPFANLPSGGPQALHRHLADSNLEVGQDLWSLERWCEQVRVEAIAVLVHDPQGLYEHERSEHTYLLSRDGLDPDAIVHAALAHEQTGEIGPRGLFALGESVMLRAGYAALVDVEPLARVGRTRIYRVGH